MTRRDSLELNLSGTLALYGTLLSAPSRSLRFSPIFASLSRAAENPQCSAPGVFYAEFDGQRHKRVIVKSLGG